MYDVIVIGAGAAGLMAAATAARNGKQVLLMEKMEKAGRKIRITGKGRCNLTNARPPEEFKEAIRTNAEFFEIAFAEFNNKATIKFFERIGVKLDIERGQRVFPKSGKAWDIANALTDYCIDNGVEIRYNSRITEILTIDNKVYGVKYVNKRGFERKEEAENVIIATGGVSYPGTGSTGDGYIFADRTGHRIEEVRPSLTPLRTSHPQKKFLDGLLLKNVQAQLFVDDEVVREEFGEISFSDRGIEGAVALRVSRDAVDALIDQKRVKLVIDMKPALTEEMLFDRIKREISEMQPEEFFSELLRKLVPKHFVIPIAHELDVHSKNYIR
ncbi:MAG: aminoacetone oxidase family FAD-binding enzyme, partial [Alistipes sp.]|nr:aminoacetone oxidase family FAD-binding enzyme [Alistipes sp.]